MAVDKHTFNTSPQKTEARKISVSSRSGSSTEQVPRQPRLQRETLLQKTNKGTNKQRRRRLADFCPAHEHTGKYICTHRYTNTQTHTKIHTNTHTYTH